MNIYVLYTIYAYIYIYIYRRKVRKLALCHIRKPGGDKMEDHLGATKNIAQYHQKAVQVIS